MTTHHLDGTSGADMRPIVTAAAPLVMLLGFAYHPYIATLTDKAAVGEALTADTTRWGVSHLLVAVGSVLTALAFLAVRELFRAAGEDQWSRRGLPLVVAGSVLFAMLPAMEIGTLATTKVGADAEAVQTELNAWFLPVLLAGGAIFLAGCVCFAVAVRRSRLLGPVASRAVPAALVVMALMRVVPLGASFYVGGIAGLVALLPLAVVMWRRPLGRAAGPAAVDPAVAEDMDRSLA